MKRDAHGHLISHPSLRQASEGEIRHATWLEIFFDLIYAVIATQLAFRLFSHLHFIGMIESIALVFPVVWIWASYTVYAARYDNNDLFHWVMTFIIIFAAAMMAVQIPHALDKGAKGFAAGFILANVCVLLLYLRIIYDESTPKKLLWLYLLGFSCGCLFWVISLFFQAPTLLVFWSLGMAVYLITPWIGRKKILHHVPLDIHYIPERFGAFTLIIIGQIIAAVVVGLETTDFNLVSLWSSFMSFVLAILIWGQYYHLNVTADYQCNLGSGQPYIYSHLPFIASFIIIGACSEYLIIHDVVVDSMFYIIFCIGIILWLLSFSLLQYIALRNSRPLMFNYLIVCIVVLFLFTFHPQHTSIMISLLVMVFILLFTFQYWQSRRRT